MKIKLDRMLLLKLLIIILTINYMVITVIFNDMILLKYSRDLLLIAMFFVCLVKKEVVFTRKSLVVVFIMALWVVALLRADSLSLGVLSFRRYIFPVILLFITSRMVPLKRENHFKALTKFILIFFAVISAWGVFQAWVLGDDFLMNLGYPTTYLNQYKRVMLGHSFYFGGLGIQRVVSTISNSNICGLILGSTLVFLLICYPSIPLSRNKKNILLITIACGYLLTFSRSNFLALLFVVVFITYKYIPYKKQIGMAVIAGVCVAVLLLIVQGSDGLIYKLSEWVKSSLNLTDTSVAGRSSRWAEALRVIAENPFGIGFGRVGSIAREAGVKNYISCENSYLAMAIDFGIIGAVLYVGIMVWIVNDLRKKGKIYRRQQDVLRSRLCKGGQSVVLYLMVVMLFSNHIYDMEAVSIIYVYVGIALNLTMRNRSLYATQSNLSSPDL